MDHGDGHIEGDFRLDAFAVRLLASYEGTISDIESLVSLSLSTSRHAIGQIGMSSWRLFSLGRGRSSFAKWKRWRHSVTARRQDTLLPSSLAPETGLRQHPALLISPLRISTRSSAWRMSSA